MKTILLLLLSTLLVLATSACRKGETVSPSGPAGSRDISISEAEALLKSGQKIVVLDVRTPEEFADGHLPGATNLNFNAPGFKDVLGALNRDTTYLVHCQAGGRSARATAAMKELGFKSVLHMNEGFSEWEAAGKPVEK
jgi:rhodanese-related sulfurtransferase